MQKHFILPWWVLLFISCWQIKHQWRLLWKILFANLCCYFFFFTLFGSWIFALIFFLIVFINSLAEVELPYVETEITTPSSPFALSLAKHLKAVGAKIYGAFWCSHCLEQKQVLPSLFCKSGVLEVGRYC